MGIALCSFWFVPRTPERTRLLNDTERTLLLARMERERIGSSSVVDPISFRAFLDACNYRTLICGFGCAWKL